MSMNSGLTPLSFPRSSDPDYNLLLMNGAALGSGRSKWVMESCPLLINLSFYKMFLCAGCLGDGRLGQTFYACESQFL